MDELILSYCGLECTGGDSKKGEKCNQCKDEQVKSLNGFCEIADCAKRKNHRFCGECKEFPCMLLEKYSKEGENSDGNSRIESCKQIKNEMVSKAKEGVKPIAYCGHHCDFCFFKEWCGGCRSEYSCCSFGSTCVDNICPHVSCAQDRGLDNCGFCDELLLCKKGFYGLKTGYSVKAKALFIKNHGETCYVNTLEKAINSDGKFGVIFNNSRCVEDAYELLESFLVE